MPNPILHPPYEQYFGLCSMEDVQTKLLWMKLLVKTALI